jgi:hypothetical protein
MIHYGSTSTKKNWNCTTKPRDVLLKSTSFDAFRGPNTREVFWNVGVLVEVVTSAMNNMLNTSFYSKDNKNTDME